MTRDTIDQARLQRLERLTTPRLTRYIAHRPTPPQTAFLLLECREAMYGGAAGGGKSDALLMAALQYVDVENYAALLLRKSYSDLSLPAALIPRAAEWLTTTDAKWNGAEHVWRFPSGASLSFGYLDTEADKYRYQSAEYQFIGFDELTQFSESQYTYMFSRLRRLKGSNVPLRMRGASNPGGYGHEWVKQRFITRRGRAAESSSRRMGRNRCGVLPARRMARARRVSRAQAAGGGTRREVEPRPGVDRRQSQWSKPHSGTAAQYEDASPCDQGRP